MASVLRYTVARCALSQIWIPPWVVFLVVVAIGYGQPGAPAADSLTIGTFVLLPIATWITISTLNSEPASQRAVLAAATGGIVRERIAVLIAATLAAVVLAVPSLVYAWALHPADALVFLIGALAHVTACLTGSAIGAAVARPLVSRIGFALVIALLAIIALIVVPHLPPVRLVGETLEQPAVGALSVIVVTGVALATAAITVLVWWLTAILTRARS